MHLLIRVKAKRIKDDKSIDLKIIINNVNPDQTLREVVFNPIFDVFNNTELEIDKEEFHIYDGYSTFLD